MDNNWTSSFLTGSDRILEKLVDNVENGMNLVPFVGAGFSAAFEIPTWKPLLENISNVCKREHSGQFNDEMVDLNSSLTDVADYLASNFEGTFNTALYHQVLTTKEELSKFRSQENSSNRLLDLCKDGVITTNYDEILEILLRSPASDLKVITRSNAHNFDPRIPSIFKIHGNINHSSAGIQDRILTKSEYNENYIQNSQLRAALTFFFTGRNLLFYGCGMEDDNLIGLLKNLKEVGCFLGTHHAILPLPETFEETQGNKLELSKLGVESIFFPSGDWDKQIPILDKIIEAKRKFGSRNTLQIMLKSVYEEFYPIQMETASSKYAKLWSDLVTIPGHLNCLIWTMNGSPLNLRTMSDNLTAHDKAYFEAFANKKFRLVVFNDLEEAKNFNDDVSDRKMAFIGSELEPQTQGKFWFTTRASFLNYICEVLGNGLCAELDLDDFDFFDFGYVEKALNSPEQSLVIVSNFDNNSYKNASTMGKVICYKNPDNVLGKDQVLEKIRPIVTTLVKDFMDDDNPNNADGIFDKIDALIDFEEQSDG